MIINFGKYKGQHISVLKNDSDYCKWLTSTAEKDPHSFVSNFVRNYLNNTPTFYQPPKQHQPTTFRKPMWSVSEGPRNTTFVNIFLLYFIK